MIDPLYPLGGESDEAEKTRPRRFRMRLVPRLPRLPQLPRLRALTFVVVALVVLLFLAIRGTGYGYSAIEPDHFALAPDSKTDTTLARARAEQRQLLERLRAAAPRGLYIVVDRTNNRLRLMRDARVELDAVCSAGSGSILSDRTGERTWIFDTPRGEFRVKSKSRNPVWRKPDWAFVEEGQPIPRDPRERIEYGTLGEFALHLGDGYMIHGTLYERLLGRNVTHGCIRLGRDDLRRVNAEAPVGTPVFIY